MVKESVDFFFNNVYPSMPFLHRQRFEGMLSHVDQNFETYCLVASLCASMFMQPNMPMPGPSANDPFGLDTMPGANMVSATLLLEETLRVRKAFDHLESPNMQTLVTNYLLFVCYYGMELHNKAWFYLREASTLAHIMMMHKEDSYLNYDLIEATRRRRLYWLLFIAERAYALQRGRPLTLTNTVNLPTISDDPTEPFPQSLASYTNMSSLVRSFDDAFLTLWRSALTSCSNEWLIMLQKQLADRLSSYLENNPSQEQDLQHCQQWLGSMVWQLEMHNGHMGSSPEEASSAYGYPIEIARGIMEMTSQFSHQSIEGKAILLLEKLYSICSTLLTVLFYLPPSQDPYSPGPRGQLPSFLALISCLRAGDHRFLPLLLSKVHEVIPVLASPMLRTSPHAGQYDYKPQPNGSIQFNPYSNNNVALNSATGHGGMNFERNPPPKGPKFPHSIMDRLPANMIPGQQEIEELAASPATMVGDSPNTGPGHGHSQRQGYANPSVSPSVIPLSMDFSGMSSMGVNTNSYDNFPDHLSVGSSMSSGQMSSMGGMSVSDLSSPLRQTSNNSWSAQNGIPRSVPEYEMPVY